MKSKWIVASGIAVMTLIGAVSSLALILNQSIRLDESQTIWMASKSVSEMMKLTGEDVHVPLYNSLIHLIITILGNNIVNLRLLSLALLLATVPALYQLTKENINEKAAIIACAFLTLSPFIIWYSAEARMYTLLLLTATINHIFFLRMINSNGSRGKLGYFLSAAAGIFSHYFFWFNLATQGIYLAGNAIFKWIRSITKGNSKIDIKKSFWVYSGIMTGLVLIFIPWFLYALSLGGASNTQPLITRPSSYNIVVTLVNFLFGFQDKNIQNILVSLWPLSAIGLLVMFTRRNYLANKQIAYFGLSAILPIVMVYLISMIRPIFLSRYLIFVVPSWFVLIGWMLADQKKPIMIGMTFFIVATMTGLMLNQAVSAANPVREDYKELDQYIEDNAKASDIVAISTPFTIYPIEYNYKGEAKLETIPQWDRYVAGSIPPFDKNKFIAQIDTYKKVYQNVYVVLSYDQGYENVIQDYMDHNFALVTKKDFPGNIEVREYKLRY